MDVEIRRQEDEEEEIGEGRKEMAPVRAVVVAAAAGKRTH